MSHGGGGGGGGMGHGGGMHHGGHHMGGGEPDSSASWNMAYVGEKRTGLAARFNPLPIFIGLVVFSVMIMPFVMDWNEPHLQRLLIGHDQTAKEIEHDNAVNQVMAGLMRSKVKQALGHEIGGSIISDPEAPTGSALIAEPQAASAPAPISAPAENSSQAGGFSISADSPAQQAYAPQGAAQQANLSPQMAPAQMYMPDYSHPGASMSVPQVPPTVGFSNGRFVSQSARGAYYGSASGGSGLDYRAARHKVVVER